MLLGQLDQRIVAHVGVVAVAVDDHGALTDLVLRAVDLQPGSGCTERQRWCWVWCCAAVLLLCCCCAAAVCCCGVVVLLLAACLDLEEGHLQLAVDPAGGRLRDDHDVLALQALRVVRVRGAVLWADLDEHEHHLLLAAEADDDREVRRLVVRHEDVLAERGEAKEVALLRVRGEVEPGLVEVACVLERHRAVLLLER